MDGDTDHLLIRETLAGNRKAFEKIVEKYYRPIYNVAYRIIGDGDNAEDIVQAVFIKAYERLHKFKFDHLLFSWLYKITVNEAITLHHRLERFSGIEGEIEDGQATQDVEVERLELSQSIDAALVRLSLDHRIVIVLFHFQDLSYEEIGGLLDLPVKTVKSRLYEARCQLRKFLTA